MFQFDRYIRRLLIQPYGVKVDLRVMVMKAMNWIVTTRYSLVAYSGPVLSWWEVLQMMQSVSYKHYLTRISEQQFKISNLHDKAIYNFQMNDNLFGFPFALR